MNCVSFSDVANGLMIQLLLDNSQFANTIFNRLATLNGAPQIKKFDHVVGTRPLKVANMPLGYVKF